MAIFEEVLQENSASTSSELEPWLRTASGRLWAVFPSTFPSTLPEGAALERSLLSALLARLSFFVRRAAFHRVGCEARDDAAQRRQLSKLLDRVVDQWLENVSITWKRLETDHDAIKRTFHLDPRAITDVQVNLGDPHAGGHTVSRWTISGGSALIYKPRPVHLEGFFSRVLDLMGDAHLTFRGLDVLDRRSHGWVRAIESRACLSDAEVATFHQRLGGLLAIAYALGATDLHEENVCADGAHPVLVDLETLITPVQSCLPDNGGIRYSVFDVGLLPGWFVDPRGRPILGGGIGGGLGDGGIVPNVSSKHLPRMGSSLVFPFEHEAKVIDGFCATWTRLCDRKAALYELCASIRQAPYRCVLRPTAQYWQALSEALRPDALLSERDFRNALARSLSGQVALQPMSNELVECELASLAALDIPHFVGTIDDPGLYDARGARVARLPETPWQTLSRRVSSLTPDEMHAQVQRIRAAFAAAGAGGGTRRWGAAEAAVRRVVGVSRSMPDHGSPPVPLTSADCLDAARAIATQLENTAIETRHGGLVWLQPHLSLGVKRWQLTCTEGGLEDGLAGIAVFFAAMARCTGERRYEALVEQSLGLRGSLRGSRPSERLTRGIRGSSDVPIGSLLYALTLCARWLDHDALWLEALTLARSVEPRSTEELGVAQGQAGTLLALLASSDATSEPGVRRELRARAASFGTEMVRQRGALAWQRRGFANGREGVTYALDRLAATGEWEGGQRWRERRSSTNSGSEGDAVLVSHPACPTGEHDGRHGLCHGSWGLALAILTGERHVERAEVLMPDGDEMELDHLCCGNAGLIDLDLELGRGGAPALVCASRRRAATLLARGRSSEGYRLRLAAGCLRPGLFDGLAGIGFMWLRQYDPELPCVLLRRPLRG
jgi:lantibiotic modifying enzyme